MNQQYFNIIIPYDPVELIKKLNINFYSLLDNGSNNFILGYCNYHNNIFTIDSLQEYEKLNANKLYLFGYIPYDEKNRFLPKSESFNESLHNFDASQFFVADGVIILKEKNSLFFGTIEEYHKIIGKLKQKSHNLIEEINKSPNSLISLKHQTSKQEYIKNVEKIKTHIQNGDIYEMNYCINFETNNANINPLETYKNLKSVTCAPFSANIQIKKLSILCASPERFLNKSQNILTSQPIKGTIKRGSNQTEDVTLKNKLKKDQKELSENIMIVDLVRNDLSKIALKSSVFVKELCKLHTFKTVHQLISTIQCEIDSRTGMTDILKSLFPMGSMTGAPKVSATNIIEKYENFKREIYSGSIGFIAPNKSFDFNVVIRSIVHNNVSKTLSISVGSAITVKSSPESEYNECLLKLDAIKSIF